MKDLRCMSFTSKGTAEIIAAGWQDTMLVVDLNKGEVTKQVSSMPLTVGIPLTNTRYLLNTNTPS